MKFTINVDATPDEARKFLGLPDIAPMQEALVLDMTERMQASLAAMDADALWRQWMPAVGTPGGAEAGAAGFDAMRQFWEQAMQSTMGSGSSPKKP